LYHHQQQTQVHFLPFLPDHTPYHLILLQTHTHYPKTLLLNIHTNQFPIIPSHHIQQQAYISHILRLSNQQPHQIIQY
ncbi:SAV0927 family protein, partial [Staphylococcus epidermidis]|uniref:SAV0927 family protein n=1 Tax=Staphylococcus epidermidis TaxID=1282 RepID=UPI0011A0AB14